MSEQSPALLRVEHGNPSPEELVALAVVLLARARATEPPQAALRRALWSTAWSHQPGSWTAPPPPRWHTPA
ncbi:acyl-CoA carboxylase subunit epsilon [Streptacidiphilus sp. PB12-B1b]|uniref:acyl-CoA carboxylase epsilon subunit n=1 Tax=Streptacidiphilus sp. PB12-B1b TaxID=2705012 RepID=UPI0015FC71CC|nr:acyl-CoA carboxylase epsilon subunit [Streptacidiphilus sp. PB12-B1b]QMU74619.1 acyl-CoA carboxylase subunit epsilon [Streptacidiphilus sp. PB12-B1b]